MKEIIVCLDENSARDYRKIYTTYDETEKALNAKENIIITTIPNFLSFAYTDEYWGSYKLFVVRNRIKKELYAGMVAPCGKEIRYAHNLEKLLIGGAFEGLWDKID